MKSLQVRNVHEALQVGVEYLYRFGIARGSRNGPVTQAPEPVSTVYERPQERVVFYPARDANPFFHFYESLWMMAGRNTVEPLAKYVKRMMFFSDNGKTFNAPYGYRWAGQLKPIITALRNNFEDRRCVLQIWDRNLDLYPYTGKDAACNLTATFQVNIMDELEMVVFCRSNDAIWGAWGANAVHFSVLHEFIARASGYRQGAYTQISVNLHGYDNTFLPLIGKLDTTPDPYWSGEVTPFPLMITDYELWLEDVRMFVTPTGRAPTEMSRINDPFFHEVAYQIVSAHDAYKDGDLSLALQRVAQCGASDWRKACSEWLLRRMK